MIYIYISYIYICAYTCNIGLVFWYNSNTQLIEIKCEQHVPVFSDDAERHLRPPMNHVRSFTVVEGNICGNPL